MSERPTVITDAEIMSVTLHADGTFGVMFRRPGSDWIECTCGWRAPAVEMHL